MSKTHDCKCRLCRRRARCEGLFVANLDGTFTCDLCIPLIPGLLRKLGNADVEVWREGSEGWTEEISCEHCGRDIPVEVTDPPSEEPQPIVGKLEWTQSDKLEWMEEVDLGVTLLGFYDWLEARNFQIAKEKGDEAVRGTGDGRNARGGVGPGTDAR